VQHVEEKGHDPIRRRLTLDLRDRSLEPRRSCACHPHGFAVAYGFHHQLIDWLNQALPANHRKPVTLGRTLRAGRADVGPARLQSALRGLDMVRLADREPVW